ncbi:MAG: insulinase family protein, partial [Planctomycetota bacterium]
RQQPPTGVGRRAQMFEVWVRPVPEERAVFSLRAALREVEKLHKDGMSRADFEFTQAFLAKYALHFAEDTEARLGYAVDDRYYDLDESHLALFRRTIASLTLEEVNAAVKKHLDPTNIHFAFVTANGAALKEALASGKPSPIDYGGIEKPAEILAADKEIEVYPLGIPDANIQVVPVTSVFEDAELLPR